VKLGRFRHAAWIHNNVLSVIGGFENNKPDTIISKQLSLNITKDIKENIPEVINTPEVTKEPDREVKANKEDNRKTKNEEAKEVKNELKEEEKKVVLITTKKEVVCNDILDYTPKSFTIAPKAQVAISYSSEMPVAMKKRIISLPISSLQKERAKLIPTNKITFNSLPENNDSARRREIIAQMFINHLLRPKEWINMEHPRKFIFKKEDIVTLTKECLEVVKTQPTVLRIKLPVKVFGDFHGQYQDLMRFFDLWRGPIEAAQGGDIESYDYLFLGDYIDRGSNSLEIICLLMALKIKFPNQIHLLRGNHEDIAINQAFGFAEECAGRLDDDVNEDSSVFQTINAFFDWLPLAAVIEDEILCLHGGIGSVLQKLSDLEKIKRPIKVVHEVRTFEQQLIIDILWSDPTDNDEELGIQDDTARDPNNTGFIVKYGPDRVEKFLENNNLRMIIRGHECVMDGIERFAKGQLITVFSATDYCGRHKNAGAALFLQKNYEILPKLIYPVDKSKEREWIDNGRPQAPPGWKRKS